MSTATQQKLEAESFLRRVQAEYPHLMVLGYQAILNATVLGMKALEIYSDNLTEAKFMAGLQHMMATGVLPKPPAHIVEVQAPPSMEQLEDQRLAELARQNEERDRRYRAQFADKRKNHAHDVDPKDAKEKESKLNEIRAKERCESIRGRTHAETEQIFKVFVTKNGSSDIDWAATEAARLRMSRSNLRTTSYRY
jgi:hypothetical protein